MPTKKIPTRKPRKGRQQINPDGYTGKKSQSQMDYQTGETYITSNFKKDMAERRKLALVKGRRGKKNRFT
jgi:hypothetical protein